MSRVQHRTKANHLARDTRAWVVLIWLLAVVPQLVNTWGQEKRTVGLGEAASQGTALGSACRWILLAAVIVATVQYVSRHGRFERLPGGALVLFLAPWAYMLCRDGGTASLSTGVILPPIIGLGICAVRPGLEAIRGVADVTIAAAVGSIALAILRPSVGLYTTAGGGLLTAEKDILPWGQLAGMFPSPNNLGQSLAVGLPALLIIRSRGHRTAALLLVGLALVWSASRSSMLAAGLALLLAFLMASVGRGARQLLAGATLMGCLVVAIWLPLTTHSPQAFSERGRIWIAARNAWSDRIWFGAGSRWFSWDSVYNNHLGDNAFHAHNDLLQAVVLGGLVGGVLAGFTLIAAGLRAIRVDASSAKPWAAPTLVAIVASGIFEVGLPMYDRALFVATTGAALLTILTMDRRGEAGYTNQLNPSGAR